MLEKRSERVRGQTAHSLLVRLCAILRRIGCLPQAPNGTGRMLCPNHHCICSFGPRSTNVMNFRATDIPTSGSIQETNQHSLVGWKSTPRLPLWDKPGGSQSSKKEDQAAEAIGMPITSRPDPPTKSISSCQPSCRSRARTAKPDPSTAVSLPPLLLPIH